jgi:opacity protein-like surface antigen
MTMCACRLTMAPVLLRVSIMVAQGGTAPAAAADVATPAAARQACPIDPASSRPTSRRDTATSMPDGHAAHDARLYVTGMVATSGPVASGSVAEPGQSPLTPGVVGGGAGGEMAVGMALPRPAGWLRLELEGRGGPAAASSAAAETRPRPWSSMVNAWRDVGITERFGAYAGGGIGAGAAGAESTGSMAWQAGAGVTYAATERVTIDLGYRQRSIGPSLGGVGDGEVMVAVRMFDPLRGWLR